MVELYLHIVIMSLLTSFVFITLKLVSKFTRNTFSATWHYYSYSLLFTLFVIPLYNWLPVSAETAIPSFTLPVEDTTWSNMVLNPIAGTLLIGSFIYVTVHIVRYQNMQRKLREICTILSVEQHLEALEWSKKKLSIKREVIVYSSPYMTTPFIYGLWKPKIVLPPVSFTEEELRHIFLHELMHYKRRDLCLKVVLTFIQALHWFNPIAYMARRDLDLYGEYSCDEKVTNEMVTSERKRYCALLLRVIWNEIDQKHGYYMAMSQGRLSLEKRIATILKRRPGKKKGKVLLGVIITVILVTSGTMVGYTVDEHTELSSLEIPSHNNIIFEERPVGEEWPPIDPSIDGYELD